MDAAMKTAMESVTHDPEVYARHHEELVRWMELVQPASAKLTSRCRPRRLMSLRTTTAKKCLRKFFEKDE
jgi:hypothetical protein